MKKRLCSLLLVLTMLSTLLVAPASALEADGSTSVGNETYVYLGVKDYGTVSSKNPARTTSSTASSQTARSLSSRLPTMAATASRTPFRRAMFTT